MGAGLVGGGSRGRRMAALFVVLAGMLSIPVTTHAGQPQTQPEASHWLSTKEGCLVWSAVPMPEESVTWSGACVDGKANGAGTEVFRYRDNGTWREEQYRGEMKGGKLHGHGVLTEASGNRYEGEFREGQLTQGTWRYANGTQYEGGFDNAQFDGIGTVTFPNGARYVGGFRHGLPNGYGTLTRSGETVSGTWANGCLQDGERIAAVGVPKEQCGVRPPAAPADHLIVPGQRIGPLRLSGTLGDITTLFGPGTDRGPSPWPGPGAVLHVWEAAGVWAISDTASGNLLWISVEPNRITHWETYATPEGIRIGAGESAVVAALGPPEHSVAAGGMRSLYYDRHGVRVILGESGGYAGKVGGLRIVWPVVAHGDLRIVPGERISTISVGEVVEAALTALGGGYLRTTSPRGDDVYYWPHLGLSVVVRAGHVTSIRSGTNFPEDAATLRYATIDGIGRGGTAADLTGAFGHPDEVRPAAQRFHKATHWWIYRARGIAFALDNDERIRIVDVFRPAGSE